MRPHEYALLSVGGFRESHDGLSCSSSSMASAAARSLSKAAIHPTAYSSLLRDFCFEALESIVKDQNLLLFRGRSKEILAMLKRRRGDAGSAARTSQAR